MKSQKENQKKSHGNTLSGMMLGLVRGRVFSLDFFRDNWILMLVLITLMIAYMTNKYTCQTKMEEVRRLTNQLEIVKTERVRMKAVYMGKIRESSMQQMIDSLHLQLSVQEKPPYKLPAE